MGIVPSDHHFGAVCDAGGQLAAICEAFGLNLSMHSNSHLGISLAAMTHLAAATPRLTYACDTHWPLEAAGEDVVDPTPLRFSEVGSPMPTAPGLGVELDREGPRPAAPAVRRLRGARSRRHRLHAPLRTLILHQDPQLVSGRCASCSTTAS